MAEQEEFSTQLGRILDAAASEHGIHYPDGGALAWGRTGASYLGYVLCRFPVTELRAVQYQTRELYGAVILDCRWYDSLKAALFREEQTVTVLLPGPDGAPCPGTVTQELFLEMLDFCREG